MGFLNHPGDGALDVVVGSDFGAPATAGAQAKKIISIEAVRGGERSYSIYLWNILARIAIINTLGRTVLGDIVWVAMFVVLAEASYRFVERPLRVKLSQRPAVSTPLVSRPAET